MHGIGMHGVGMHGVGMHGVGMQSVEAGMISASDISTRNDIRSKTKNPIVRGLELDNSSSFGFELGFQLMI